MQELTVKSLYKKFKQETGITAPITTLKRSAIFTDNLDVCELFLERFNKVRNLDYRKLDSAIYINALYSPRVEDKNLYGNLKKTLILSDNIQDVLNLTDQILAQYIKTWESITQNKLYLGLEIYLVANDKEIELNKDRMGNVGLYSDDDVFLAAKDIRSTVEKALSANIAE